MFLYFITFCQSLLHFSYLHYQRRALNKLRKCVVKTNQVLTASFQSLQQVRKAILEVSVNKEIKLFSVLSPACCPLFAYCNEIKTVNHVNPVYLIHLGPQRPYFGSCSISRYF